MKEGHTMRARVSGHVKNGTQDQMTQSELNLLEGRRVGMEECHKMRARARVFLTRKEQ